MHINTHVYTCIYVCVEIYLYMYVHTYISILIHTCREIFIKESYLKEPASTNVDSNLWGTVAGRAGWKLLGKG